MVMLDEEGALQVGGKDVEADLRRHDGGCRVRHDGAAESVSVAIAIPH